MAETSVENQICDACGVDIRRGALFCYNCGGAVASQTGAETNGKIAPENQVLTKESLTTGGNRVFPPDLEVKTETKSAPLIEAAAIPVSKFPVKTETNLKSAAALRKKPKNVQNKKVEVIWERSDYQPNVWFVLAAVVIALFAAVMLWLALYL